MKKKWLHGQREWRYSVSRRIVVLGLLSAVASLGSLQCGFLFGIGISATCDETIGGSECDVDDRGQHVCNILYESYPNACKNSGASNLCAECSLDGIVCDNCNCQFCSSPPCQQKCADCVCPTQ
jgi:hypothetical protein